MAETIQLGCKGGYKWHWYNVLADLITQGGLKEKDIQWSFSSPNLFFYKEKHIIMSWVKNQFLLVSMKDDDNDFEKVINAFSKIVGYEPFCKYFDIKGFYTCEWDKLNPEERFNKLQKEGKSPIKI